MTSIEIPATVSKIGKEVFSGCINLNKIEVIKSNSFSDVNTSLAEIDHYTSEDGVLFSKDTNELLIYPSGKTDETYTVPNGVSAMATRSFDKNEYLQSIYIGEDVKTIGESAFQMCTNLKEVHLQQTKPNDLDVQFDLDTIKHITLFVPDGTVNTYRQHPEFSKFKEIKIGYIEIA